MLSLAGTARPTCYLQPAMPPSVACGSWKCTRAIRKRQRPHGCPEEAQCEPVLAVACHDDVDVQTETDPKENSFSLRVSILPRRWQWNGSDSSSVHRPLQQPQLRPSRGHTGAFPGGTPLSHPSEEHVSTLSLLLPSCFLLWFVHLAIGDAPTAHLAWQNIECLRMPSYIKV